METLNVEEAKQSFMETAQKVYPGIVWSIGDLDDQKDSRYFKESRPDSDFCLLVTAETRMMARPLHVRWFLSSEWLLTRDMRIPVESAARCLLKAVEYFILQGE